MKTGINNWLLKISEAKSAEYSAFIPAFMLQKTERFLSALEARNSESAQVLSMNSIAKPALTVLLAGLDTDAGNVVSICEKLQVYIDDAEEATAS